jgi:hypothetical protein
MEIIEAATSDISPEVNVEAVAVPPSAAKSDVTMVDAEIQTDKPEKKKGKKGKKGSSTATPRRPSPSANDTLVATYMGEKDSGYQLMKDVCSGNMLFVTEQDILVKLSDYKFRAYSDKNAPAAEYKQDGGLVSRGMKLKYSSKAKLDDLLGKLKTHSRKGDVITVNFYVSKKDAGEVTPKDVDAKNVCWYYAAACTQQTVIGVVPLNRSTSNKKKTEMHYGEGTKFPIMSATSLLMINSDGVAVTRTDCKGHVELTFPTHKRFQSYWVKGTDLPNDLSTPAHIMVSKNSVYLSMDSEDCPGRYHVVVGMRKKFASSRVSNSSSGSEDGVVAEKDVEAEDEDDGEEEDEKSSTTLPPKSNKLVKQALSDDDEEEDEEEDEYESASETSPGKGSPAAATAPSSSSSSSEEEEEVVIPAPKKKKAHKRVRVMLDTSDDEDSVVVAAPPKKMNKKHSRHISAAVTSSISDDSSDSD